MLATNLLHIVATVCIARLLLMLSRRSDHIRFSLPLAMVMALGHSATRLGDLFVVGLTSAFLSMPLPPGEAVSLSGAINTTERMVQIISKVENPTYWIKVSS